MSHRELLSEQALLETLNAELSKHAECQDCQFTGTIHKVANPPLNGCNWKTSLVVKGRPTDPQACGNTAADVIVSIANRFNLE